MIKKRLIDEIEKFKSLNWYQKIFYIFQIIRIIIIALIIVVVIFIIGFLSWLAFPSLSNNEKFIKNNFMNEYKKNTKELVAIKPNKPLIIFTEKEERDLLVKSGCEIEKFSYEVIHETYYGDQDKSTVTFSCRNTGIRGKIEQDRLIGNEYNSNYGDRYNSISKGTSRCYMYIEQPNINDDIHCSTESRISLKQ